MAAYRLLLPLLVFLFPFTWPLFLPPIPTYLCSLQFPDITPKFPYILYDSIDCIYVLILTQSNKFPPLSTQLPTELQQVSHFTGNLSTTQMRHNSTWFLSTIEAFSLFCFSEMGSITSVHICHSGSYYFNLIEPHI